MRVLPALLAKRDRTRMNIFNRLLILFLSHLNSRFVNFESQFHM
jgi:hypothetical protein